jgi:hypothetical protein
MDRKGIAPVIIIILIAIIFVAGIWYLTKKLTSVVQTQNQPQQQTISQPTTVLSQTSTTAEVVNPPVNDPSFDPRKNFAHPYRCANLDAGVEFWYDDVNGQDGCVISIDFAGNYPVYGTMPTTLDTWDQYIMKNEMSPSISTFEIDGQKAKYATYLQSGYNGSATTTTTTETSFAITLKHPVFSRGILKTFVVVNGDKRFVENAIKTFRFTDWSQYYVSISSVGKMADALAGDINRLTIYDHDNHVYGTIDDATLPKGFGVSKGDLPLEQPTQLASFDNGWVILGKQKILFVIDYRDYASNSNYYFGTANLDSTDAKLADAGTYGSGPPNGIFLPDSRYFVYAMYGHNGGCLNSGEMEAFDIEAGKIIIAPLYVRKDLLPNDSLPNDGKAESSMGNIEPINDHVLTFIEQTHVCPESGSDYDLPPLKYKWDLQAGTVTPL